MPVTQDYKITYETLSAARFALRARVLTVTDAMSKACPSTRDYWQVELDRAEKALAELDAL